MSSAPTFSEDGTATLPPSSRSLLGEQHARIAKIDAAVDMGGCDRDQTAGPHHFAAVSTRMRMAIAVAGGASGASKACSSGVRCMAVAVGSGIVVRIGDS